VGVFISEAVKHFPSLEKICAVEKDILSAHVLEALLSTVSVKDKTIHTSAFQETPQKENGNF